MAEGKVHYGVKVLELINAGILKAGDEVACEPRKGEQYRGIIGPQGEFVFNGKTYRSPSAAASALAGRSSDGWWDFSVNGRPLKEYRSQFMGGSTPTPVVPPQSPNAFTQPPELIRPGGTPANAVITVAPSEFYALIDHMRTLVTDGTMLNEADTRAHFLDRYLAILGYGGFNDVRREYFVKDLKEYIDYLLYVEGTPTIAVEAKALRVDLTDATGAQLIKYAAIEGIEWCVLSNARQLFVYNQYLKGTVSDKLVLKLDLLAGESRRDLDANLDRLSLLSKAQVLQGSLARLLEQFKLDRSIVEILNDPGNAVVRSIRTELKKRYGLQIGPSVIADWLNEHFSGV